MDTHDIGLCCECGAQRSFSKAFAGGDQIGEGVRPSGPISIETWIPGRVPYGSHGRRRLWGGSLSKRVKALRAKVQNSSAGLYNIVGAEAICLNATN